MKSNSRDTDGVKKQGKFADSMGESDIGAKDKSAKSQAPAHDSSDDFKHHNLDTEKDRSLEILENSAHVHQEKIQAFAKLAQVIKASSRDGIDKVPTSAQLTRQITSLVNKPEDLMFVLGGLLNQIQFIKSRGLVERGLNGLFNRKTKLGLE